MSSMLFRAVLTKQLIIKINSYLQPQVHQNFIKRWMSRFVYSPSSQLYHWKLLVRDSQDMILRMKAYQQDSINFATFISQILKRRQWDGIGEYLEQFCMQAIINNPELIQSKYNKYYSGNGGNPLYQMLAGYLLSGKIDGTKLPKFEQLQPHIFNILSFILQNKYLYTQQHMMNLAISFRNTLEFTTTRTVQTVSLLLQYLTQCHRSVIVQNISIGNDQFMLDKPVRQAFTYLFTNLVQSYSKYGNHAEIQNNEIEHSNIDRKQAKKRVKQIIKLIDNKYTSLIRSYSQPICKALLKYGNAIILSCLLEFKSYSQAILTNTELVFGIFGKMRNQECKLIWGRIQCRERITRMRVENLNILEMVCTKHMLTHNLIGLLWESKLFEGMPHIRNRKSRQIISQKYRINFNKVAN